MVADTDRSDSEVHAALAAFMPMDRRQALAAGRQLPASATGAALFADISGFTPLTESLVLALGPQRGAEELTGFLNRVYDALIAELYAFGGSVIGFSGDAITCWLDGDDGRRAVACGLAMQRAMQQFAAIPTPGGAMVSLAMKAAVAAGAVRRFVVGDPGIQLIDVLAGQTLDHLAAAEHLAQKGEVVVHDGTALALDGALRDPAWRADEAHGDRVAVVGALATPMTRQPWPAVDDDALPESIVRQWVLPPVYHRLRAGSGDFLAELRPAVALFLRFGGLDFEHDDAVADKLDAYVRWVQGVLARFEGTLVQLTIGDKGSYLYAAFGAPIAHEDDAVRAVSAAFELRSPPGLLAHIGTPQIGISRGRMRTGAYGARDGRTYGVLGDETNMAARLMQAAAPGQIVVSEAARRAAVGVAQWEQLPPQRVKGKSNPVTAFLALAPIDRRPLRLQEPRYTLPMVGREAELALIAQRLAHARRGKGQIVGIVAEAGMGKSRLVAEAVRLAQQHGLAMHAGECQSYGSTASYLVWQDICRGLFALDGGRTVEEQIAALADVLAGIDPGLLPRLPLLGALVNLAIPDTELTRSFDPKLRKSSLEALLVDCLRALAARSPLLLVFEDCHWIDALSRDLVEAVGRAVATLPAIMVLSYRPPDAPGRAVTWVETLPHSTEIRLGDFSAEEAAQLIALKLTQLAGEQTAVPAELARRLTERADGNPFYIEELINYIRDRGIDPRDAAAVEELDLPTSLHSLILSRIDQLSERQKVVLKVASVLGRRVQADWLCGAYWQLGGAREVRDSLDALSAVDLLSLDQPEPDLVYIFKHVVNQQVAYESLPFALRATLHAQLGQFIERVYGETLDQYVTLLAFHYERTDDLDKKRHYLLRAGEAAQAAYANAAAIGYFQRLLPLLPEAEHIRVRLQLGQVLELVGEWGAAREHYSHALRLAEGMGDGQARARGCRAMGWLLRKQGEYREAATWLAKAQAAFDDLGDRAAISQVMADSGEVSRVLSAFSEAKTWYDEALRLAESVEELGPRLQARAHALKGAGTLAAQQGDNATARMLYEESLAIRRELGDRPGVAVLLNNLGIIAYYLGDYAAARALDEEALAAFRQIGDRFASGHTLNNLAGVAAATGDYATARQLLAESVDIQRQFGEKGGLAYALNSLADVLLDEGDSVAARPLLVESLALNAEMGEQTAIAYLLDDFAALAAAEGQPERAVRLAGAAAATRDAIGAQLPPSEKARFDGLLASARQMLGEHHVAASWNEGRTMTLDQAVNYALDTWADAAAPGDGPPVPTTRTSAV